MRTYQDAAGNFFVDRGLGWVPAQLGSFVSNLVASTAVAAAKAAVAPGRAVKPPPVQPQYAPLTREVTCRFTRSDGTTYDSTVNCATNIRDVDCCNSLARSGTLGSRSVACAFGPPDTNGKVQEATVSCDNLATAVECCDKLAKSGAAK